MLGIPRAEVSNDELRAASRSCLRRSKSRQTCNVKLDDNGYNAMNEEKDGGVISRHKKLERAMGSLIKRWQNEEALYDQRVAAWQ